MALRFWRLVSNPSIPTDHSFSLSLQLSSYLFFFFFFFSLSPTSSEKPISLPPFSPSSLSASFSESRRRSELFFLCGSVFVFNGQCDGNRIADNARECFRISRRIRMGICFSAEDHQYQFSQQQNYQKKTTPGFHWIWF